MLNKLKFDKLLTQNDVEGIHLTKTSIFYTCICVFRSRVDILNRRKRTINCHVLISCQARYPSSCTSKSCRTAFFSLIQQRCSQITDISLQLALVSLGGSLVQFALQFLGFSLTGINTMNNFYEVLRKKKQIIR